jgi:hypothetical protein
MKMLEKQLISSFTNYNTSFFHGPWHYLDSQSDEFVQVLLDWYVPPKNAWGLYYNLFVNSRDSLIAMWYRTSEKIGNKI